MVDRRRLADRFPCLVAVLLLSLVPTMVHAEREPIALAVDATDAPRKMFHSRLVIPVAPGPLSLSYPKWIPGEHAPTGPLTDVVGLHIMAGAETLAWQRDLVDMYAIRCVVPAQAHEVTATFDFLTAMTTRGYSSAASVTEQLAMVSWNQVLLYPTGEPSDQITYEASLKLPSAWSYGTALPVEGVAGGLVQFKPVSLTTLVDSPVLAGLNFRSVRLGAMGAAPHFIDMACDSREGLDIPADVLAHYRRLVGEAQALFGAHHYGEYHFLLSLSDHIAHFGLEHHQSSDDRAAERMWIDDDLRLNNTNLLPHEFVHSWNGKYRRPADLATPDFQQPMKDDLLWVYEGLTQYLGWVLGARSGVRTTQQALDNLALSTAALDHRVGRTWRPLVDTAVEAQLLYDATEEGTAARRGVDFYDEGVLIWLEADVRIRSLTGGRRSMDDFCHLFHGGKDSSPRVVPYTFDDVVSTLNQVAPADWRGFLKERLESLDPRAPMGGIQRGGWRVVYRDSIGPMLKASESANKYVDAIYSLGIRVGAEDGAIRDVVPGSPAGLAGMAPGMKLVAVNGRHWTKEVLQAAIRATRMGGESIELMADNGDFYKTFKLDYHGGARYPRLERIPGTNDVLSAILRPHGR